MPTPGLSKDETKAILEPVADELKALRKLQEQEGMERKLVVEKTKTCLLAIGGAIERAVRKRGNKVCRWMHAWMRSWIGEWVGGRKARPGYAIVSHVTDCGTVNPNKPPESTVWTPRMASVPNDWA